MVILQLSNSAPSCLPVGSPVTFISSLQHAFLFTKVYSVPPLPSAGVCQMSPDVSNSIGLYDMPFTSNKLQQRVLYSLVPLHRSHYTHKHTHTPSVGFLASVCCEQEGRESLSQTQIKFYTTHTSDQAGQVGALDWINNNIEMLHVWGCAEPQLSGASETLQDACSHKNTHAHHCSNDGMLCNPSMPSTTFSS